MIETRMTIFHKILLVIFLLLIPIVLLYGYSNYVSESVVEKEIQKSLQSRLSLLNNRLTTQMNHMSRTAIQLSGDPSLDSVNSLDSFKSYFNIIQFKRELYERIAVQSNTMEWPNIISVYFPKTEQVITPKESIQYDKSYLTGRVSKVWKAWQRPKEEAGGGYDFYYYAVSPYSAYADPLKADNIVELRFSDDSLIRVLDDYKKSGKGDPFLYHTGNGWIPNSTADKKLADKVRLAMNKRSSEVQDSFQLDMEGNSYLVNSIPISESDWVLVDFVSMEQVLSPIEKSKSLFYVSTLLLLLMGTIAAFLLYRNVQIPIIELLKNLQKVKRGDFSARIEMRTGSEFQYVFQRFNEMSEQIGELVEHVYREKLATRDAQLKQMQSQINPHFLYNCLYFIVNMVRLGDDEAAEKMAVNLGDYFKYTTRLEKQDATIEEEIRLLENYLEIQNLRMHRIKFGIAISDEMRRLEIPRLLLQPIVENAVIHGIELVIGGGEIRITGSLSDLQATVIVEDSGAGLTEERRIELQQRLAEPVSSEYGYGVWNVNQRLLQRFGEGSGVRYERSELGGLMVILTWNI